MIACAFSVDDFRNLHLLMLQLHLTCARPARAKGVTRRSARVVCALAVLVAAVGCGGGGGGGGSTDTVMLEGKVQKGLFSTLQVKAIPLDKVTGQKQQPLAAIIDDQTYTANVPVDTPILIEATGTYLDDVSGQPIELDQPMLAMLPAVQADVPANVNLATTLAAQNALVQLVSSGLTPAAQIEQANALVVGALGMPVGTQLTQLDYGAIDASSTLADPNLQLLVFSGAVSNALATDELFGGGFGTVFDAFGGAQDVTSVLDVLGQYGGAPASPIYDAIQKAGNTGSLPLLDLLGSPTWGCDPQTGCGFQPQPSPTIAASSAILWESEGVARVRVYLGQTAFSDVTVEVTTREDTALEDFDFEATDTQVVIPAQAFAAYVDIPIPIDDIDEPTETFFVEIDYSGGGYTIPNDEAKITVYDGAPALSEVAPDQLVIAGLCLNGVGRPGDVTESGCPGGVPPQVGVSVGNADAAAVELDLAATCTTGGAGCAPQQRNWLVHFYLVARDSGDVLQTETPMGDYVYKRESVQLQSAAALPRPVQIALHSQGVIDAMDEATRNGWGLEIEARIGPPPSALTAATDLPSLLPVPSTVIAGGYSIDVYDVESAAYGDGTTCDTDELEVTASFGWQGQGGVESSVCIEPGPAADGKYQGTLTGGEIDFEGLLVPVAKGHIGLTDDGDGFQYPFGFDYVFVLPELDVNGDPVTTKSLLHREGWPFLFEISGGRMTPAGAELEYDGLRYVHTFGYSTQDPRFGGNVHSNDAFYRAVSAQGTLAIDADGNLSTDFTVPGGSGHTAFPKADASWGGFAQTLTASEISNQAGLSITSFALDQEASCRAAECLERSARRGRFESADARLDPRGFVVAAGQTQAPSSAGWGQRPGGTPAWSRPDEWAAAGSPATIALPGYRLDRSHAPTSQLLAHLEPATEEHVVHPLGSLENADGNFFPTGVSFGPEFYRDQDQDGLPRRGEGQDSSGKALRVDNGVDVVLLDTSLAAKYVVRNGGVTGVFNADPAAVAGPITLYGYDLELTRFAVRVVDNQVDPFNWVDGSLTMNGDLGGPGGFDLHFTNLEIDCAARLGQANLAFEACNDRDDDNNGVVDENCDHRLWAWNADAETFAMGFEGDGVCDAGAQQLVLDQQATFEALDGPVGIEGRWSAGGALTGQQTALQKAYRLDEREGSSDAEGFAMRPSEATFAASDVPDWAPGRYGWVEITDSLVGVPFWNALESDVRVANRLSVGQPTAEPTVMTGAGSLGALGPNLTNTALQNAFIDGGPPVRAHYQWGKTGFGFTLPVYYSPWQFNREQSKFLGIRKEADLFVFEAGAGIDFIEPERTKLSFGASADFEKLRSVRFQLDLENPESLRAVDDLLVGLRILDRPVLEPALSGLQEDVGVLNKFANKGLDEAMQKGLERALEELGAAAGDISPNGEDPFVTLSEALAQVKSYPQQVAAVLDGEVRGPIDAALARHESALRSELLAFESSISSLSFGDEVPDEVFDELQAVRNRLAAIDESVTTVIGSVQEPVDELRGLVGRVAEPVARAKEAALVIDQLLFQTVSFTQTACASGDISGGEGSGYLEEALIRVASVQRIFDLLESNELLIPLTELLDNDPELRDRIESTRRDIKAKTEELTGFVDEAEAALKEQVCDPRIAEVLDEAGGIVDDILAGAVQIEAYLATADQQLLAVREIPDALYEFVILPVQEADSVLASLQARLEAARDSFDSIDGDGLIREFDGTLAEMTGDEITLLVKTGNESGTDVLDVAFGLASRGIHDILDDAVTELDRSVDGLMPGALFTPEELRRMFVGAIMASPPVENLRLEMEKHLGEINSRVNDLLLQLLDQLNLGIRGALATVESKVNEALDTALAPVRNIPLDSAGLDGFGVIAGNELERAHIAAEWTMSPSADGQEGNTFGASLDAVSWSASNKGASCGEDVADGRIDVTIAALGLPATVAGNEIILKKVYLGFNLANNAGGTPPLGVKGVYGGLAVTGDIGFSEAIVYDPAFAAGIGDVETYLGASAGAMFSDIQAEVAFLVGRTCNDQVLLELDPEVAKFIELPPGGFAGAYLRGAASIPLLTLGCPLTVGVGAEFGSWILAGPPLTLGGLVGGAAYGKVACVGAIRGQIRALGQVNTDGDWMFSGEGFGAAGVGWCEPSSWTTKQRSRDDDWCATGDASFRATFTSGKWDIPSPSIGAVY